MMIHMTRTSLNKKTVGIIAGVVAVIAIVGLVIAWGLQPSGDVVGPTPKPTLPPEPVNIIPIEERAYARILPADSGREVTISLETINKEADEAEYEVEYQSGTILQGFGGNLDVENLPSTARQLLGSCSAGGKCSYDENVTGGQLTLRFEGPQRYAVRGEWSFIDNASRDLGLSSRDGKLGLSGPGSQARYGVVFQSPGYPAPLPAAALSQIYSFGVAPATPGSVVVSLRLNEDVATAKLAVWNGKEWKLVDGTVADKTLTVSLPNMPQAVIAVVAE